MQTFMNTPEQMGFQSANVTQCQQDSAAALLDVCRTLLATAEKLAKTQKDSTVDHNVLSQRSHLSSTAQPFMPCSDLICGLAGASAHLSLLEQSASLGGMPGMGMAPGDCIKYQYKMPSESSVSSRPKKVERQGPVRATKSTKRREREAVPVEVKGRCPCCGNHLPAKSQFCCNCGVPVTTGVHCSVNKHPAIGFAIVSFQDVRVRQAILRAGREETIAGIKVQLRPHKEKFSKEEIPTDIFVAWGHQVEKSTPLQEHEIVKFFDEKHVKFAGGRKLDNDSSSGDDGDSMSSKSTSCGTDSSSDDKVSEEEFVLPSSEPMYVHLR